MAMKAEEPIFVALYLRASPKKQSSNFSIVGHINDMRLWAEAHGYQVKEIYGDFGGAYPPERPEFQRMIAEATRAPVPFSAIIVDHLSQFSRDIIECQYYERKLNRAGIKVISITKDISDDAAGMMVRRIIDLFDEYASKENAKHTLRAMKENARQGNFNGSQPPFGYQVVEVDLSGSMACRKRLIIHPEEAAIVIAIFEFYLNGNNGFPASTTTIAAYLNQMGIKRRGKLWSELAVRLTLLNRAYIGEYYFNKRNKTGQLNPEQEWVRVKLPPIIEDHRFEQVQRQLRKT